MKEMIVQIKESVYGHKGIGTKYLVTGMSKRAIIVVLRPFHVNNRYLVDSDILVYHAAKEAAGLGWKVVYVFPHFDFGEYAYFTNAAGFNAPSEFEQAKFLCSLDYDGDEDFKLWVDSMGKENSSWYYEDADCIAARAYCD